MSPGESRPETVDFTPTSTGPAVATWAINADDGAGLHEVTFTGTGVPPTTAGGQATVTSVSTPGSVLGGLPEQGVLATTQKAGASPNASLAGAIFTATGQGALKLRVSCPATVGSCAGKAVLQIAAPKPPHALASALLTIASRSFTIAGGRSQTLTLRLSARARALLARLRTLHAQATIVAHDSSGATRTQRKAITIHAPRARNRT